MKRNIIFIVSIFLVIIVIITYSIFNTRKIKEEITQNNKPYESFYGQPVLGTDVISLINKAIDNNEKNAVERDEKGNYIDNEKDSIIIKIKFLELEDVISMEAIEKQGIQRFIQNFGAFSFKCTNIEYHQKTGNVKQLYFEQIESSY